MRAILFLCVLFASSTGYTQLDARISGVSLVAPRDSFERNPMQDLNSVNCSWVAVIPYAFTPAKEAKVYFGNNHQWWGETPRGAEHTIQIAKESGLKVMLKPQLWIHNSWVGDLEFDTEKEWSSWELSYKEYIIGFARIAERNKVEILCIGTEFKKAVQQRPKFWRKLIKEIREHYSGLLTYCSNWDSFEDVPFWKDLDLIGISAYFPLSDHTHPEVDHLKEQWEPIKKSLSRISKKYGKKILFTEYGYLSVNGCAGKTWELERVRMDLPSNERAQANALEALYSSFCDESYWVGGFLWKWYPNGRVRPGFKAHDYTPQDKLSEQVIKQWYGEFNSPD
jgi:hypothetical protein